MQLTRLGTRFFTIPGAIAPRLWPKIRLRIVGITLHTSVAFSLRSFHQSILETLRPYHRDHVVFYVTLMHDYQCVSHD
jgi:hypothetical protein